MSKSRSIAQTVALILALGSASALAQHVPANLPSARAGMTGNWFSPDQAGHGIQIEMLDAGRALVAWYTYDRQGNPLWLFGAGRVQGTTIEATLSEHAGGRPPAHWGEATPVAVEWGKVSIDFDNCQQGTLAWESADPDFGTGTLPLARLTSIAGVRCDAEERFGLQLTYSFERGAQGFAPVFADLPVDYDPGIYELDFQWEQLPPPLQSHQGLRLTGHNRSDDLAMLVKAPIRGLEPEQMYRVELELELASNVPQGCAGVGGSPGEGVYLKLGASTQEPRALPAASDNWLRLNVDYGIQSESGNDAVVAGILSNTYDCEDGPSSPWELKTVTTEGQQMRAITDADGTLWVFAGTDSAFEGLTHVYFTALRVRLDPMAF